MKKITFFGGILLVLFVFSLLISCQQAKKEEPVAVEKPVPTTEMETKAVPDTVEADTSVVPDTMAAVPPEEAPAQEGK